MRRPPQLDGLRGVAVLMVFFIMRSKCPLFWCGINLFFVLSGYLITGVLLRLKADPMPTGFGWRNGQVID